MEHMMITVINKFHKIKIGHKTCLPNIAELLFDFSNTLKVRRPIHCIPKTQYNFSDQFSFST